MAKPVVASAFEDAQRSSRRERRAGPSKILIPLRLSQGVSVVGEVAGDGAIRLVRRSGKSQLAARVQTTIKGAERILAERPERTELF